MTTRHEACLARIDAALAEAERGTPGPWAVPVANVFRVIAPEAPHNNPRQGLTLPYPWRVVCDMADKGNDGDAMAADAAFIALARTLTPAALRALREVVVRHVCEFHIETAHGGYLKKDGTWVERLEYWRCSCLFMSQSELCPDFLAVERAVSE